MARRPLKLFLTAVALAISAWGWKATNLSQRFYAVWRLYQHSRYVDFTISGEVVEEDGSPLEGVTVEVMAARLKNAGTDSDTDTQYIHLQHSKFHVQRNGYSEVYLKFLREGFEPQEKGFAKGDVSDGVRVVMHRKLPATTGRARPGGAGG